MANNLLNEFERAEEEDEKMNFSFTADGGAHDRTPGGNDATVNTAKLDSSFCKSQNMLTDFDDELIGASAAPAPP